jgi:hypothetical protein
MSGKPAAKRTRPKSKTFLRLPDLDQAKAAVLNSLTSADAQHPETLHKRGYCTLRIPESVARRVHGKLTHTNGKVN